MSLLTFLLNPHYSVCFIMRASGIQNLPIKKCIKTVLPHSKAACKMSDSGCKSLFGHDSLYLLARDDFCESYCRQSHKGPYNSDKKNHILNARELQSPQYEGK